jgi:hypothetical protein
MIRADSTLPMPAMARSFHKASRPIAQRTGRPRLFGAETFEEGIGGRLGRSDPRTPGVKFEPGLAGTATGRGEDASGSVAMYAFSGEPCDSSTTVSMNSAFPPAFFSSAHEGCHFAPPLDA